MCPPHLCERCYIWRQYQSLMSTSPCRTQCEFSASLWIVAWLSMITRQPQQDRAITMCMRSATYAITDVGLSTDAQMKPYSLENRLLQLGAVRRTILHHSEASASPEKYGACRSGSVSMFSSTFVLAQGVLQLHDSWLWHCRRRCRTGMTLLDICTVYVCACSVQKSVCAFEMYVLIFDFYTLTHAWIHR